MKDVHDSPFAAGCRDVPRRMGPTFGCPSMLPSARYSSCIGPALEVLLQMHIAVISGLLQPLTKSLHLTFQHYH
jgi:hypothetical protein